MMKVIKTDADYRDALERIETLMDGDPEIGTRDADELEVWTLLAEDYESKKFPASLPDPIEAITFRMEQQNLAQRDLIPYIGSRSKVSEVLSGKRPLTLSMMRALHANLGIPARVLLQERDPLLLQDNQIDWIAIQYIAGEIDSYWGSSPAFVDLEHMLIAELRGKNDNPHVLEILVRDCVFDAAQRGLRLFRRRR